MKINLRSLGNGVPNLSAKKLNQLMLFMSLIKWLKFDIDGCILPAKALETSHDQRSLEEYCETIPEEIKIFRDLITALAGKGINIGICTGRSVGEDKNGIALRVAKIFFPEGLCKVIIGEGGATAHIWREGEWVYQTPKCVDLVSLTAFREKREEIIRIGTELLGGHFETGKKIITSFNPPLIERGGKTITMPIKEFSDLFSEELEKLGVLKKVNIKYSKSAVDVSPLRADKVHTMLEFTQGLPTGYVGDAMNDSSAMFACLLNLSPANISSEFSEIVGEAMCCMVAEEIEIAGTISLLQAMVNLLEKDKSKFTIV